MASVSSCNCPSKIWVQANRIKTMIGVLFSKTQYKMARLILYALKNDIVDENKLFK